MEEKRKEEMTIKTRQALQSIREDRFVIYDGHISWPCDGYCILYEEDVGPSF